MAVGIITVLIVVTTIVGMVITVVIQVMRDGAGAGFESGSVIDFTDLRGW